MPSPLLLAALSITAAPALIYVLVCLVYGYPLLLISRLVDLLKLLFHLKGKARQCRLEPTWTVEAAWNARVKASADHPFMTQILSSTTSKTLTYKQVDDLASSISRAASSILRSFPGGVRGASSSRVVAIMMPSCVEYVACWMGLLKLRVTSGLINTNLSGAPFVHAVVTAVGTDGGLLIVSKRYLAVATDSKVRSGSRSGHAVKAVTQ